MIIAHVAVFILAGFLGAFLGYVDANRFINHEYTNYQLRIRGLLCVAVFLIGLLIITLLESAYVIRF